MQPFLFPCLLPKAFITNIRCSNFTHYTFSPYTSLFLRILILYIWLILIYFRITIFTLTSILIILSKNLFFKFQYCIVRNGFFKWILYHHTLLFDFFQFFLIAQLKYFLNKHFSKFLLICIFFCQLLKYFPGIDYNCLKYPYI